MAGRQIIPHGVPGLTLYGQAYSGSGTFWNGSAFEAYNASNWATYALTATEYGASGLYWFDWPTMAQGAYEWLAYLQSGGSPATTDLRVGASVASVDWSGSGLILLPPSTPTAGTVLELNSVSGNKVYGVIFNEAGQVWNGSSFGSYSDGSWGTYAVLATETGTTGVYRLTFPAGITTAGRYTVAWCSTATASSPALGDAKLKAEPLAWNGSAIQAPGLTSLNQMVGSPVLGKWELTVGSIAAGANNVLDGSALSATWTVATGGTIAVAGSSNLGGVALTGTWQATAGVIAAGAVSNLTGSPVLANWSVAVGVIAAAASPSTSNLAGSPVIAGWSVGQGGVISSPVIGAPAGDEEEVPDLTDAEQAASLVTIRSNCLRIMAEITASPKPSYSIDGQAVSWTEYMRMLREQIDWIDAQMLADDPFLLETYATLD